AAERGVDKVFLQHSPVGAVLIRPLSPRYHAGPQCG
ncbi:hypothetical protein LTSERUB_1026, partial [Salmonella enterica subsp. enterica serovar Rubislaw str. A4-653]